MRERTAFNADILAALPNLKLLVTTGARNAAIDLEAATARGIQVCGTRSVVYPTAELTWGLILALTRNIVGEDRAVRAGHWQMTLGSGLSGKTLGIVGLGRLGTMVAEVGRIFGMNVVAWSQNIDRAHVAGMGVAAVSKADLFRTSDVISVHLVLSERTRNLIGSAEFAQMKSTALFVNTSRAQIVDEEALVKTLQERRIGGVALDVFSNEPLPVDSPLRHLPNLLLSPHMGYVTKEAYEIYYSDATEDIRSWRKGRLVRPLNNLSH